jgi:hypothetical protein
MYIMYIFRTGEMWVYTFSTFKQNRVFKPFTAHLHHLIYDVCVFIISRMATANTYYGIIRMILIMIIIIINVKYLVLLWDRGKQWQSTPKNLPRMKCA